MRLTASTSFNNNKKDPLPALICHLSTTAYTKKKRLNSVNMLSFNATPFATSLMSLRIGETVDHPSSWRKWLTYCLRGDVGCIHSIHHTSLQKSSSLNGLSMLVQIECSAGCALNRTWLCSGYVVCVCQIGTKENYFSLDCLFFPHTDCRPATLAGYSCCPPIEAICLVYKTHIVGHNTCIRALLFLHCAHE